MDVSVYEAKTHLSRLLNDVEAGMEITITRHGRPVARLVPAIADRSPEERMQRAVEAVLAFRELRGQIDDPPTVDELIGWMRPGGDGA